MKYLFKSIVTTEDGRITKDVIYDGALVNTDEGMRVFLYSDNKRQRMTFDPKIFVFLSHGQLNPLTRD